MVMVVYVCGDGTAGVCDVGVCDVGVCDNGGVVMVV